MPKSYERTVDERRVEQDEKLRHNRIFPPSRLLSKDSSVMNDEKKENKSFEGVSFMMMDFDNGRNLGRSN